MLCYVMYQVTMRTHRLATIHNVTDGCRTDRRNTVPIARPLVRSAKNSVQSVQYTEFTDGNTHTCWVCRHFDHEPVWTVSSTSCWCVSMRSSVLWRVCLFSWFS